MIDVPDPDGWAQALTGLHTLAVEITTLADGEPLTEGISGTVNLDANAENRGRLDLSLQDDGTGDLIPTDHDHPLAPFGQEVQVKRGINDTLVSLGVFRIEETSVDDSGDSREIRISGLDRSAKISEANYEEPFSLAGGLNIVDWLRSEITFFYPDAEFDFPESDYVTVPMALQAGDSRWALYTALAQAMGMELFANGEGKWVLRPVQTDSSPVTTLSEGENGILLPPVSRQLSRQGAINRVVWTAENSETATDGEVPRAIALDNDPNSPTYYYGTFGRKTVEMSSALPASQQQCQDAANAYLAKNKGLAQSVNFNAVPDTRLEPSDVVTVVREASGINQNHWLDSLGFSLGLDAMSATSRTVMIGA